MEKLIPSTLSTDLCMRHGATLAAGELILALHRCDYVLSSGWYSYHLQTYVSACNKPVKPSGGTHFMSQ